MSSELQSRKDEEYEMQLLGFTSRGVYTTVENIATEKIQSCCRKLCEPLHRLYTGDENCASMIRNTEKNLAKLYFLQSKPHKNGVKKCIKKFIAVPKNVLLEEDLRQRTQYSKKESEKIERDLENLQSEARKAPVLRAALQEELDQLAEFELLTQEAEIISSVIENSTMHSGVDGDTVNCVEKCQSFDAVVEKAFPSSSPDVSTLNESDVSSVDLCSKFS